MTDQQMIEAIAMALATSRNHREPNSTDTDFATKFLHAYRAMKEIEGKTKGATS